MNARELLNQEGMIVLSPGEAAAVRQAFEQEIAKATVLQDRVEALERTNRELKMQVELATEELNKASQIADDLFLTDTRFNESWRHLKAYADAVVDLYGEEVDQAIKQRAKYQIATYEVEQLSKDVNNGLDPF
jgi:uncharacterized Fe-S cluster-containing protein